MPESPPSSELPAPQVPHDPYIALRFANFRRYFVGNAFALLGTQMAGLAIGWEIYGRTNSKVALGLVGFVQVLPIVALSLPAGHIVDRLDRKKLVIAATSVLVVSYFLMGLSSRFAGAGGVDQAMNPMNRLLAAISGMFGEKDAVFRDLHIPNMLGLLLINGICRALNQPAKQSLMPALVPPEHFSNAVTWSATAFETSNVVGPMLAGFAIALMTTFHSSATASAAMSAAEGSSGAAPWAYTVIYWFNAFCQLIQLVNMFGVHLVHTPRAREPLTLKSLLAGVKFVYNTKVILGTITLDMFAVLLGGATTLLPVFAKDILKVGAFGLGWLQAASSIGAISMALLIAHAPPMRRAGRNLMLAVCGFGVAMVVFGLSQNFWLSMAALILSGACDNISVVVRHSLVQLMTPDTMRGRVSAVNSVFISTSNELGGFESGITAALGSRFWGPIWGPMIAVAAGGVGTLLVVGAVANLWPQVAAVKALREEVVK